MKAKKEAQDGKEDRDDNNSGPSDLLAAEDEEDVIF